MKPPRTLLRSSVLFVFLLIASDHTWAEEYLSNLGDLWPDPTGNTIGDIEVLTSYQGPFIVQFLAGSGTNEMKQVTGITNSPTEQAFELTSVTFEFWGGVPQPWSDLTVYCSPKLGPVVKLGKPRS